MSDLRTTLLEGGEMTHTTLIFLAVIGAVLTIGGAFTWILVLFSKIVHKEFADNLKREGFFAKDSPSPHKAILPLASIAMLIGVLAILTALLWQ